MVVIRALRALVAFLLPTRCAGCGRRAAPLCPECSLQVRRAPPRAVVGARSVVIAGRYAGPLRRAVLALKNDQPGLAPCLARRFSSLPAHVDCVTWVPAGPRRRKRGYDQGEALARAVAGAHGWPARALLGRAGRRGQRGLGAAERWANASASLTVPCAVPGWEVLLVDDVLTTGASLERSVALLLQAGASAVDVAVIASASRPRRT